ncbi:MAG: PPA1309 family protein [Jatrophihabitantaceae bacterium]
MPPDFVLPPLDVAAAEIETFVGSSGWDQRPALFALVRSGELVRDDPQLAERLGLGGAPDGTADALTPVEQDDLPEGDLDEVLGHIGWPDSVAGCAIAQEIVILPPSVAGADPLAAASHPERREARLVVAVLRGGARASVLRLRRADDEADGGDEQLLSGPDLAPNLVAALQATLHED